MKQIIAACGYRCDLCPVFEKNIGNSDKNKLSEGYLRYFDYKVSPEEIKSCGGCSKEGDANCPVEPCVIERDIENCAHCDEFPCEKLKLKMNAVEDRIKDVSSLPDEDYNLFVKPYEAKKYLLNVKEKLKDKN